MPKVVFLNEKKELDVPVGSNLRQEARRVALELHPWPHRYLNCSGFGLCGTCRILVKKGMENLSPKGAIERAHLSMHPLTMLATIGHEDQMRLACQVVVNGDCEIETQPGVNVNGENFWQKPYPNK